MIVDPWGTVVARASDRESVIFADIDLEYLRQIRLQNQCLENIRSNIREIKWKESDKRS
jgi:predicted amidohydrolase